MAKRQEEERFTIGELEEAERLVDTLGSTLEVLITGYGTGMCADGKQTADVLEMIFNYVQTISAKLDDLGQCIVMDGQELRSLKGGAAV